MDLRKILLKKKLNELNLILQLKSTVCEKIRKLVVSEDAQNARQIITLSQDSFYRDLTSKESEQAKKGMFNFDHPGKLKVENRRPLTL